MTVNTISPTLISFKNQSLGKSIKTMNNTIHLGKSIIGGCPSIEVSAGGHSVSESYLYKTYEDRDYDFNKVCNFFNFNS